MSKTIKKLSIEVEKGGMLPPKSGEIIKQKLTIKNNGQVWWTAWRNITDREESEGFEDYVVLKEYKKTGKIQAELILKKAEEVLLKHIDENMLTIVCDASLDEIVIEYEDGEFVFGQLNSLTYELDEVMNFYYFLQDELQIEKLFFFDECVLE